jgi:WD40 repeat protein
MRVTQRPPATRQIIIPHSGWVGGVALSPDGATLASACSDCTARLWNPKTGKELGKLEGHSNALSSIAISPSGEQLATGSFDQTAKLWNVATR